MQTRKKYGGQEGAAPSAAKQSNTQLTVGSCHTEMEAVLPQNPLQPLWARSFMLRILWPQDCPMPPAFCHKSPDDFPAREAFPGHSINLCTSLPPPPYFLHWHVSALPVLTATLQLLVNCLAWGPGSQPFLTGQPRSSIVADRGVQ